MSDFKDRVKDTTTTTGTGTITLAGLAPAGHRTFFPAFAAGVRVYYTIVSSNGSEWEVGHGTLVTSTTLARTTILTSSNSGAAVNFSAGTKEVICAIPAATMGWKRFSNVPVSHTGNTLNTTLTTVTIPGGLLQANSVIHITALWSLINTFDFVNVSAEFGGALYLDKVTGDELHSITTIYCNNSVSAQKGPSAGTVSYGAITGSLMTSSVNTANPVDIVFKGQLVDPADTVTLEGYRINIDI